jgi:formate dehydrogenase accessory protein FdhE
MDIVKRVTDSYLGLAEGSLAARLRFLEGLWAIQSRIEAIERPYEAPDAETAREALVTGQPLFLVRMPVVPLAEYVEAATTVGAYVVEAAGLSEEQSDALSRADWAAVITESRLEEAVRDADAFFAEVARALGVGEDTPLTYATVAFVLASALVPFLAGPSVRARAELGESDLKTWDSGSCPVCGSAAAMGRMGERTDLQGAERTLWCGLCHAEWGYARIRCVRCGTRKPDVLRYSYLEDDPAHRLHLCDQCHGYVRFVFEDELRMPVAMVVEDAVSTNLEAIAQASGYSPGGDEGPAN